MHREPLHRAVGGEILGAKIFRIDVVTDVPLCIPAVLTRKEQKVRHRFRRKGVQEKRLCRVERLHQGAVARNDRCIRLDDPAKVARRKQHAPRRQRNGDALRHRPPEHIPAVIGHLLFRSQERSIQIHSDQSNCHPLSLMLSFPCPRAHRCRQPAPRRRPPRFPRGSPPPSSLPSSPSSWRRRCPLP